MTLMSAAQPGVDQIPVQCLSSESRFMRQILARQAQAAAQA